MKTGFKKLFRKRSYFETHQYEIVRRSTGIYYEVNIINMFGVHASLKQTISELDKKYRGVRIISETMFLSPTEAKKYLNQFVDIINDIESGKLLPKKKQVVESDSLATFVVTERI